MNSSSHRIAIVGAGLVGEALATRLVSAGYSVSISNSRGPDSLREQEKATGATAQEIQLAMAQADIVILAVPMVSITSLRSISDQSLRRGAILIDCGNYYPTRDGRIEAIESGTTETVWVSEALGRPVIKAFNNIIAGNIVHSAKPRGSPGRVTLPVSGDDEDAKTLTMELVDQVGFDPYDAGPLVESWRQQPGTPAYCTEPSRKELVTLLGSANREKAAKARESSRKIFEKLPSNYDPDVLMHVARLSAGLDMFKLRAWSAAIVLLWSLIKFSIWGHA